MIAKTFAYPRDARDPSKGRRLIETRILKREPDGWVGLPYVWNAAQTEATLDVAGDTVNVSWIHTDGRPRTNNYIIPNVNQCKGCHKSGEVMTPIGPKARHLNRDFAYREGDGEPACPLEPSRGPGRCTVPERGAAAGRLGRPEERDARRPRPRLAGDQLRPLPQPRGPGANSGLDLLAAQRNPAAFGVNKPPVAAGIGSGGRQYDIVPGQPDESILAYRIASTHPGVMMPELGKRLVHEEGVALVRQWIAAMADRGEIPSAKSSQDSADSHPSAGLSPPRPHLADDQHDHHQHRDADDHEQAEPRAHPQPRVVVLGDGYRRQARRGAFGVAVPEVPIGVGVAALLQSLGHERGAGRLPGVGLGAELHERRVEQLLGLHEIGPGEHAFRASPFGASGSIEPLPASISSRHRSQAR